MTVSENHYVFIVHGTFSPPGKRGEPPKWYEPEGAFAQMLARELEQLDAAWKGVVWRPIPQTRLRYFGWSGDNTHAARVEAAGTLSSFMLEVWLQDPRARIHLVGHSHGGNVILKALELYGKALMHYEGGYRASKDQSGAEVPPEQIEANKRFDAVASRLGAPWGERPLADTPELHRLGRVVFLGTPFFHKQWRRTREQLRRRQLLVNTVDVLSWFTLGTVLTLVATGLLCYLPVLGVSALAGVTGAIAFVGFNPLNWSPVLVGLLVLLIVAGLGLTAYLIANEVVGNPRWRTQAANTNFYFDHVNVNWLSGETGPRIPALVVNAGPLDEAISALSSQPLLEIFGKPAVAAFTGFRLDGRPRPPEVGVPHEFEGGLQRVKSMWLFVRNLAAAPIMAVAYRFLHQPTTDWLMNTMRQVVVSAASGLPPNEVDDAALVVRQRPEVTALEVGEVWDVSEYLAHHRSNGETALDPQRYRFLWDTEACATRFSASRIGAALTARDADSRLLANVEFQRMCLAIEERVLEVVGGMEVLHSRYYQEPAIVKGVARFIFDGARPAPLPIERPLTDRPPSPLPMLSPTPRSVAPAPSPQYAQIMEALARLQARWDRGGYVVIRDVDTDKFVQFAGSALEWLLFDLPFAKLTEEEKVRAEAFFRGIEGVAIERTEEAFHNTAPLDAEHLAELAVGVFRHVFQVAEDFELDFTYDSN